MLGFFKSRKEASAPEPTCEQIRADRRKALLRQLALVNSDAEVIAATLTDFLYRHKVGENYIGDESEVPFAEQERLLRKREGELNTERSRILAELAPLTVNEKESVHIEGKLIRA